MLALAGYPLGIDCTLLDRSADAPGGQVAKLVRGELADPAALEELAAGVGIVTLEIENVAVAALEALAGRVPVYPPPAAVAAAQDRLAEKTLFRSLGIPTAEFVAIDENTTRVDGGMSIFDLRDELGFEIPEGDYETIAGFVLDQLGHIPREGETVNYNSYRIVVSEVKGVKIESVVITRQPEPA